MLFKIRYKTINIILLICSFLLLIYTGYRAYSLPFTHDESYSFNNYYNLSFTDILTYNFYPIIANNHILNTFCMNFASELFGNSEFALRLHSLLAHIAYLIFTYLILKEFKSKFILAFGFMILNCNPYLLDFFSLARGYALSITLMIISLYSLVLYIKHNNYKTIIFSLIFAILGVLANFSLMSYTVALIIVYELVFIIQKEKISRIFRKNIPIAITIIIMLLIYVGPIKSLVSHNQLNFGGENRLWESTVISSICCYLYTPPYSEFSLWFLKILTLFVSISSLMILIIQFKNKSQNYLSYISIILIIILLSNVFQHLYLNGSYFSNRFALFLVPLFFFSFINVIYFLISNIDWKQLSGYIIAVFILMFSTYNLLADINLTHYCNWVYDASTKDMLTDLSKEKKGNQKIKLGVTWLFEPSINFYRETKSLQWLEYVNRDGLSGEYDYYYVDPSELETFNTKNKTLLKVYPVSEARLYKKID